MAALHDLGAMDQRSVDNTADMPTLYRLVLDLVAELEPHDRSMAQRIRRSAICIYSVGLDGRQYGRLELVAAEVRRRLDRQRKSGRARVGEATETR
jgi:hypothetical protein